MSVVGLPRVPGRGNKPRAAMSAVGVPREPARANAVGRREPTASEAEISRAVVAEAKTLSAEGPGATTDRALAPQAAAVRPAWGLEVGVAAVVAVVEAVGKCLRSGEPMRGTQT
jgi:hypothetical protein